MTKIEINKIVESLIKTFLNAGKISLELRKKGLTKKLLKMEIYVGNLPWSVRDQELAEAFGPYGSVEKASVITYRDSGRSKGFGFVTMNNDDEANKAIEAMNGHEIEGRPLRVNEARPKEESSSGNSDW